jgi:predicted HAD superfamily phosphohydrolase YqeG
MYKNVIPPGGNASTSGSVRQGTITNKIKAIVYDLDGTLLDTESLSTEAIQAVVGAYGKTFTWYVFPHGKKGKFYEQIQRNNIRFVCFIAGRPKRRFLACAVRNGAA